MYKIKWAWQVLNAQFYACKKNIVMTPTTMNATNHTLATFSCEIADGNAARFELVEKVKENLLHF